MVSYFSFLGQIYFYFEERKYYMVQNVNIWDRLKAAGLQVELLGVREIIRKRTKGDV